MEGGGYAVSDVSNNYCNATWMMIMDGILVTFPPDLHSVRVRVCGQDFHYARFSSRPLLLPLRSFGQVRAQRLLQV